MTPPPSRPLPFLNLQGRQVPVLENHDVSASVAQLQSLARLAATVHAGRAEEQHQSYRRLLLLDAGEQGRQRLDQQREEETAAVYASLREFIGRARDGDRRSYFDAMRSYYVLTHRMLESPQHRAQVPAMLREFQAFARQYRTFLGQQTDMAPEERFRYLYFAAGVIHNVLGRTQHDAESAELVGETVAGLGVLLHEYYEDALNQHRRHLLAHPDGEPYTPIVREIQMRQALIAGDAGAVRQRARELLEHLAAHPPGQADPNRPETRRWDLQAARLLERDPEFHRIVQGLDSHSPVENAGALLNGVTLELLLICASGIDHANGESETVSAERYQALSSVVAMLSLTRPAATLRELIVALADSSQESALRAEIERAVADNAALASSLQSTRGETSLNDWIARAARAAAHVRELEQGPGQGLLPPLLEANELNHPVHVLGSLLEQHPQLLAELGLSPEAFLQPTSRRQAALELLRRGSLGAALLQAYQARHPGASLAGIVEILGDENLASNRINAAVATVLESFHAQLDSRPDHEIAALHGVFQVLGQTSTISEDVRLDARLSTHSQQLAQRMEGYGFRTSRAWGHLTSAPSLATIGAGIFLSEAAPALMLFRAGSAGRLVARGVPLVRGGAVTWQGAALTGIGTGLGMSLIGSGLHNAERRSQGLQTQFWSDFGHGALVNTLTFAGTIPFQRWLAGRLAPAAGEGRAIGQLSRGGRLGVHFGTALFGTTLALGLNTGLRRWHSGEWSAPSYEEVAEIYMGLLAWEVGAAGVRRLRSRIGLRPTLEGRPLVEPIRQEVPAGAGRFARLRAGLNNGVNRATAAIVNPLFTVLGEHRAIMVREATQRIIERNPQLAPLEEIIAHRLATEEIAAPGSLDQYTESFLQRYQLEIAGDTGRPRLLFVLGGTRRSPSRGYTSELVQSIREQLETCSANDPDYLPRYLPRTPYEIVQIRVDPATRRIVGVGTHVFGEGAEGAIVLNASFNPQTRTLRLPPVHGETSPASFRTTQRGGVERAARIPQAVEVDLGPMFDAHRSSPLPMVWTEAVGRAFLRQRLNQAARARLNQAIGDLNRDAVIRLPIDIETGRVLDRMVAPESIEDLPSGRTRILRIAGRYDGREKTLTVPAPRGQEGEYVLDMNTGRIRHALPEGAEGRPIAEAPSAPRDPFAQAQRRRLASSQREILAEGASGSEAVTVFFGNRSGKILGISRGRHSESATPEHLISENLPENGRLPRRLALQGRRDAEGRRILLEVPATEERPAGTLGIDLESGEIRFETTTSETPARPADTAETPVRESAAENGVVDSNEALDPEGPSGPQGGPETE